MNIKTISQLAAGAALALALSAPAFAQAPGTKATASDGDTSSNFKGMPRSMKGKMMAMDTDKDGMVSKAEFLAYASAMFDKMDADHKGMMTPKQYMAFAKAMSADVVGKSHE